MSTRGTAPPQWQRLVLKEPACLVVAREGFKIAQIANLVYKVIQI